MSISSSRNGIGILHRCSITPSPLSTSPFFEVLNSEKGQKGGYTIVLLYKQIRQVTDIITPPPFVMNETMLKTMGHFQLLIHVRNFFFAIPDSKGYRCSLCKFIWYLFHTYFFYFLGKKILQCFFWQNNVRIWVN